MEKYIITTGKTIDLAIQNALAELSLDRDAVSVEVLENAKTGFLGIGASPAKVKVTYEVPDPKPAEPAPALSAASRKPKKQAPKLEKPLEMPKPPVLPTAPEAPKKETPKAEAPKTEAPKKEAPRMEQPAKSEKPAKNEQPKKQAPKKEAPKAAPKAEPKEYAPAEPGSQEEKVETFLKGLKSDVAEVFNLSGFLQLFKTID